MEVKFLEGWQRTQYAWNRSIKGDPSIPVSRVRYVQRFDAIAEAWFHCERLVEEGGTHGVRDGDFAEKKILGATREGATRSRDAQ